MSHAPPQHATSQTLEQPRQRRILALLCLAQAMLVIDITVVNVALPSIGGELDLDRAALTWIVTGYTLCFGGLMLLGGRLSDLYGRRLMLLIGLAVFTAASLTAGLAADGTTLLVGRLAQGIGAALMSPAALSTLTTVFHGRQRNRALGVWSAIGGAGAALGVIIGGALTDGPGWQWAFYINIPVAVVIFIWLPGLLPAQAARRERARIDVPGALLVTGATAALVFGLVRAGDHGWASASTLTWLTASGVLYLAFFGWESRARQPLIRIGILARRTTLAGVFLMLIATTLLISYFFLGSLYLQDHLSYSPLETGLLFLPAAVTVTLGAHLAGRNLARVGPRAMAVAGFLLAGVGAVLLTGLDSGNVYTGLLPGFAVTAFGLGGLFVAATATAMSKVAHEEAGVASGIINTFHELGGSIGVALMSTVAAASIGATVPTVEGFTTAFTVCAVVSLAAAAVSVALIPGGRIQTTGVPHVH